MLLFGDIDCIPQDPNLLILNLSSYYEGFYQLRILPPPEMVDYNNDVSFDIFYAQWILLNDEIFYEFFDKVMQTLYLGLDVFILVGRTEFLDRITESIIKFIQERYHYIGYFLNEISDMDGVDRDKMFYDEAGVVQFDQDKMRHFCLMMEYDPPKLDDC